MTKAEVTAALGSPAAARASITNKHGQVIEVWEYDLYPPPPYLTPTQPTKYLLLFCENKLVSWGEAGDWRKEADRIYEMRFR